MKLNELAFEHITLLINTTTIQGTTALHLVNDIVSRDHQDGNHISKNVLLVLSNPSPVLGVSPLDGDMRMEPSRLPTDNLTAYSQGFFKSQKISL